MPDEEHRAARCFGIFAICHAALAALQCCYLESVGSMIVVLVAFALVWDNGILAFGRLLFPEALRRSQDLSRLIRFSQPRFYAHALLTPLLAIQATNLGGRAGVGWLKPGTFAATGVAYLAVCLSIFGTLHHARYPTLMLRHPANEEPQSSWMRSIVCATLADTSRKTLVWMIGPAVLVCVWTVVVGATLEHHYRELSELAASFKFFHGPLGDDAGRWLWICALVELLSNAGPPWVAAITGNLGEVVLLAGFVFAERELTLQGFGRVPGTHV